jgi:hypothetical protein
MLLQIRHRHLLHQNRNARLQAKRGLQIAEGARDFMNFVVRRSDEQNVVRWQSVLS